MTNFRNAILWCIKFNEYPKFKLIHLILFIKRKATSTFEYFY